MKKNKRNIFLASMLLTLIATTTTSCNKQSRNVEAGQETQIKETLSVDVDMTEYEFGNTTKKIVDETVTAISEETTVIEETKEVTVGERNSSGGGSSGGSSSNIKKTERQKTEVEKLVLNDVLLGEITIGGRKLDITNYVSEKTFKEFIDTTKLNFVEKETLNVDNEDFMFIGHGYSLEPDFVKPETVSGVDLNDPEYLRKLEEMGVTLPATQEPKKRSLLFLDVQKEETDIVEEQKTEEFEKYRLKGVGIRNDTLKDEEKTIFRVIGDIGIGTTEQEVLNIFGKGAESKINNNVVIYQNDKVTLIIVYAYKKVNEIYLINN